MSFIDALGATGSVFAGGTVGGVLGLVGYSYLACDGKLPESKGKQLIAATVAGMAAGAFAGAWAHSALTDTSVSVPTIASGISVSSVGGLTPPDVV